MHKIIFSIVSIFLALATMAQIKDPVSWTAKSRKKGDAFEIVITATLPKPWHIYSQSTGDGGPLPTTIKFTKNPLVTFDGAVKEKGDLKQQYDKLFDTNVKYYGEKVEFIQSIKVKGKVKTNVNVVVEYMTCDDSQCLPPTKKSFNVSL